MPEHKINGLENILSSAGTLHSIDTSMPDYGIITTRAVRDRYTRALENLARERNEAAYEWTRLRWWQWRKRKRLYRKLFGLGGWSVLPFNECDALGIPRRVVPTHVHRRRIRRGFSE